MFKFAAVFFSLFPLVIQASSYSQFEVQDEKNYSEYERSIEKQLQNQNLDDSQKFYLYSWAIQKMENVNIRGFRKKYLKKILKLDVQQNKAPYFIKLADLYYQEGNSIQLRNVMEQYVELKGNSSLLPKSLFYSLKSSQKLSQEFLTSKQIEKLKENRYQNLVWRHDLEILVERKKWTEAFTIAKKIPKTSIQDQLNYLYLAKITKAKKSPNFCSKKNNIPLIKESCQLLGQTNTKKVKETHLSLKDIFPEYKAAERILSHAMEAK